MFKSFRALLAVFVIATLLPVVHATISLSLHHNEFGLYNLYDASPRSVLYALLMGGVGMVLMWWYGDGYGTKFYPLKALMLGIVWFLIEVPIYFLIVEGRTPWIWLQYKYAIQGNGGGYGIAALFIIGGILAFVGALFAEPIPEFEGPLDETMAGFQDPDLDGMYGE